MVRLSSPHRVLFLVSLALLAGCRGRVHPPRQAVCDLIADFDLVEVEREPGLVDLGTPEARALLRKGWAEDETDGDRTFVWSDGPESEAEFYLAAPRDVPLTLRGEPYRSLQAPPQEVELVVNGASVQRIAVTPERQESRVVLPERALRAGRNWLVLRYAWTRSPAAEEGGSGDPRHLAVAWDLLRFETGADTAARVRPAGDRLSLPFGTRLHLYQRLPAGAALSLAGLGSRDGEAGALRVAVQAEGEEEREVARLRPQEEPATVELGNEAGLVRISLGAVPEDAQGARGAAGRGLVLRQPAVIAPGAVRAAARPRQETGTTALASLRGPTPGVPLHRPRNVIVYLVDTLRADHLGCYGYGRPVSPRIDAFAAAATRFRHTVAQSSWTRPAVTTVLTGLLPRTHRVLGRRDALSGQALTLAEVLQSQGYRTAGFVTNGNVARSFGLGQGFDTYQLLPSGQHAATDVNAAAAAWLETRGKGGSPFFLYLHTVEPHAPYNPPLPFRQRFAPQARDEKLRRMRTLHQLEAGDLAVTPAMRRDLVDLYDAEIATNDAAFGELVDLLVRRGLWEDTVVVFVGDHGEEFLDHGGWEHGRTLHAEMLDVPLIVHVPGAGSGRVVERQAQQVDVAPTVLDALGLAIPGSVEGRSLLPWIDPAGRPAVPDLDPEEAAFSWLDNHGVRSAAATTPAWKLIENRSPHAASLLYDRRNDPGERQDRASDLPVRTGYLGTRLHTAERPRKGTLKAGEGTLDAELRKQLQALGYVQ